MQGYAGLNDVDLIHLHASHTHTHINTHAHLTPQGLPSLPLLSSQGPSLLTRRITTAERVIRGCEGLRGRRHTEKRGSV